MLWRRKYGRIGWFALPTFWVFEYLGPLVELAGYGLLLFLFVMEQALHYPLINSRYLWAFLLASLGYGVAVNVFVVLTLLLYAVIENFGYRQLTLYWRLRGLWDAWRGKTGWEKFARVGFRESVVAAHG